MAGGRWHGTWRPTGPQDGPEDGRIGCSYGRAAVLWVVWPHRPKEAIVAVRALRERYFLQLLLLHATSSSGRSEALFWTRARQ